MHHIIVTCLPYVYGEGFYRAHAPGSGNLRATWHTSHSSSEGKPQSMTGKVTTAPGHQGPAARLHPRLQEELAGCHAHHCLPPREQCCLLSAHTCSHTFCDNCQWLIHHLRLQLAVFSDTHFNTLTFLFSP